MTNKEQNDFITIEWHVDDVLEVRPDLTKEQAREVLHTLKHDAHLLIDWQWLYQTFRVADAIYPKEEA